jgi:hypothetical protein
MEMVAESAESTIAGGFFKFFELAPKVRDILAAHNHGDHATAWATGLGTVTEYGLALYLLEALGIAELFMVELNWNVDWLPQLGQAVAGTVGVTKVSEFSGEVVEKTTHQSLAHGHGEAGHGGGHGISHSPATGDQHTAGHGAEGHGTASHSAETAAPDHPEGAAATPAAKPHHHRPKHPATPPDQEQN